MGLTSTTRSGVQAAFDAVGDLKTSVTHVSVALGLHNVTTDTTASVETSTVVDAVLVKDKAMEQDWTPKDRKTMKCLIAYTDLSTEPKLDDYITIATVDWQVTSVNKVPGNSVWILRIREP